jgi:hypothetical protein
MEGKEWEGRRMKPRMTREEALAFQARWRLVSEAELEELRATSPETKLRQLAALMASVEPMGWTEALQAEEQEVRERWIRLRKAYGF